MKYLASANISGRNYCGNVGRVLNLKLSLSSNLVILFVCKLCKSCITCWWELVLHPSIRNKFVQEITCCFPSWLAKFVKKMYSLFTCFRAYRSFLSYTFFFFRKKPEIHWWRVHALFFIRIDIFQNRKYIGLLPILGGGVPPDQYISGFFLRKKHL